MCHVEGTLPILVEFRSLKTGKMDARSSKQKNSMNYILQVQMVPYGPLLNCCNINFFSVLEKITILLFELNNHQNMT